MTTRSSLDQALDDIRDDVLRLGSLVNKALELSLEAFKLHDTQLAQAVVNEDERLDDLHNRIEENVTRTFALQNPLARDLRRLVADLLISNELERMGDHAEGIARAALRYSGESTIEIPRQIPRMAKQASQMVLAAMSAYASMNPDAARDIAPLDDVLDKLYHSLFSDLVEAMSKGKLTVEQGTYLLWVGHGLERIGDRVTNICERIVYARTGSVKDFNPKPHERGTTED